MVKYHNVAIVAILGGIFIPLGIAIYNSPSGINSNIWSIYTLPNVAIGLGIGAIVGALI